MKNIGKSTRLLGITMISMLLFSWSWSASLMVMNGAAWSTDLNTLSISNVTTQGISATSIAMNLPNMSDKLDSTYGTFGFTASYNLWGAVIDDGSKMTFNVNSVTDSGMLEMRIWSSHSTYGLGTTYDSYFLATGDVGYFNWGSYTASITTTITGISETRIFTMSQSGIKNVDDLRHSIAELSLPNGVNRQTIVEYGEYSQQFIDYIYQFSISGLTPKADGTYEITIYPRVLSSDGCYSGDMKCELRIEEIRMWSNSAPAVTKKSTQLNDYFVDTDYTLNYNCYLDYYNNQKFTGGTCTFSIGTEPVVSGVPFTTVNPLTTNAQFAIGPNGHLLSPGIYDISCSIDGYSGIPSASASYHIVMKNDDPDLFFTQQPEDSEEYQYGDMISLAFTPYDYYSEIRTWTIAASVNNVVVKTFTGDWMANVPNTINIDTKDLGEDTYKLTLTLYDGYTEDQGIKSKSYNNIIVSDSLAPSITLLNNLDIPYSDAPIITVDATDVSAFSITFGINGYGTFPFTSVTGITNRYEVKSEEWISFWNNPSFFDGTYGYTITATDQSIQENTATLTGSIKKDQSPPTISSVDPEDFPDHAFALIGEHWNAPKDIYIRIMDLTGVKSAALVSTSSYGFTVVPGEESVYRLADFTSFSNYFNGRTDGDFQFYIYVVDQLDNDNSIECIIVKDTLPAEITVDVPQFAMNILGITASSNEFVYLWYSVDSQEPVEIPEEYYTEENGLNRYSLDISALDDGSHTIDIFAMDLANNQQTYSTTFTKDTQNPVINIINPSSIFEHDFNTIMDSNEPINIAIFKGDTPIAFGLVSEDDEQFIYTLSIDDLQLAYGINALTIKTTDRAGNIVNTGIAIEKKSSTVTFTISAQNSLTDLKSLFAATSPTLITTILANAALLDTITITIGETTVAMDEFDGLWASLDSNTYNVHFRTTSLYGNTYTQLLTLEKDVVSPSISINTPVADDYYDVEAPIYSITVYEPNIKRMWYTIVNSTTTMTRTITSLSGGIEQSFWDNALTEFVTIEFGVEDLCGNIAYNSVTIKRTDWIGPRGQGIDLGLFLGMGPMLMAMCGIIFAVAVGSTVIVQKKRRVGER